MRRLTDLMGLRQKGAVYACGPEGAVAFVVGDVHGCVDLLSHIHQKIRQIADSLPVHSKKHVIYLGDYIGHGTSSCDVIDLLVSAPLEGFKAQYLLGDRDLQLLHFLRGGRDVLRGDPKLIRWLNEQGGIETLRSYDVPITVAATPQNIMAMRVALLRKMPTDHISFLQNLEMSCVFGDFFCSHTGMRSTAQHPMHSDLLRGDIHSATSTKPLEKVSIHAHAALKSQTALQSRISVYSDPVQAHNLSCLLIHHDKLSWIDCTSHE